MINRCTVIAALLCAAGCSGSQGGQDAGAVDSGSNEARVDFAQDAAVPDGPLADQTVDAAKPDAQGLDLTGYWAGTWSSNGGLGSGAVSGSLAQSGAQVTGQLDVTDNLMISSASVSGSLTGNQFVAKLTSGPVTLDATLTVAASGQSMTGTWTAVGDSGTLSLSRATPPDAGLADAGQGDATPDSGCSATTTTWAHKVADPAPVYPRAITVDSAGDIYITGSYSSPLTLGSFSLTANAASGYGSSHTYLAKMTPGGTFLWAAQSVGADPVIPDSGPPTEAGSATGATVALDSAGNVYVAGDLTSTVSFGSTTLTATDPQDAYVAKLDPSGAFVWAIRISGSDGPFVRSLAVTPTGEVYVAEGFDGSVTVDSTTLTATTGNSALFVAKLSTAGQVLWVKQAGWSSSFVTRASGIARTTGGDLVLTGDFGGSLTVGSTTLTSKGQTDLFIAKLDSAGTPLWATSGGGAFNDFSVGVAADSAGGCRIVGKFASQAQVGPVTLVGKGIYDILVAALDSAGNVTWVTSGGGAGDDWPTAVAVDPAGATHVSGHIGAPATFGSHSLGWQDQTDLFAGKVSAAGSWIWALSRSDQPFATKYGDEGLGIATDSAGSSYVTGRLQGCATFGATQLCSTAVCCPNTYTYGLLVFKVDPGGCL